MSLHVVPVGDLIEHVTTDECPCGPRDQSVKRDYGSVRRIVMHHSVDDGERSE